VRLPKYIMVTAALVAAAAVYFFGIGSHRPAAQPATFQGYMVGDLLLIGAEEGGRITEVFVKQRDGVVTLSAISLISAIDQQAKSLKSLASAFAVVGNLRSI
jgi:multidrug resistance efflux pump